MNKNAHQYGNHFELIRAIKEVNFNVVQSLVCSLDCAINAADEDGYTPLHHACRHTFSNFAETLLQYGADPNLPDNRGNTSLHQAVGCSFTRKLVQPLLTFGANLALSNHAGQTALHLAAASGESQIFKLMIQHGAQIDARDATQRTPLHYAAQQWIVSFAVPLLEAGADPHAVDAEGNTPLHLSATKDCSEIVSALLDAGANPDVRNHAGQCPLELSVGRTSGCGVGVAVVLLTRGAATTQAMLDNLLKNTVRRAGSIHRSRQLVETLLQHKASTSVLTDRDFRFLLAQDKRVIRFDKSIGLTKEAQGVLRLLSNHREIPPYLFSELL